MTHGHVLISQTRFILCYPLRAKTYLFSKKNKEKNNKSKKRSRKGNHGEKRLTLTVDDGAEHVLNVVKAKLQSTTQGQTGAQGMKKKTEAQEEAERPKKR